MQTELASVVVRTKDRPIFLKRCLESICSQTYPNIEIVLVNDGGEDVSETIRYYEALFKANKDVSRKFRYVFNKTPTGRTLALKAGIESCSGKYIGLLDDDDFYYADHVALHVEAQKTNGCNVSVSKSFESIEENYIEKKKVYYFPKEINRISLFFFENYFPINSVMFRRDLVEKIGGVDASLPILEDWDLFIRLFAYGKYVVVGRVTTAYTTRNDVTSARMGDVKKKTWAEAFRLTREKYIKKFKEDEVMIPLSEVSSFLNKHAEEWYVMVKENEALRDSFAYKLYYSKTYNFIKKIGRLFNVGRV